jgi:hypothetical protein
VIVALRSVDVPVTSNQSLVVSCEELIWKNGCAEMRAVTQILADSSIYQAKNDKRFAR